MPIAKVVDELKKKDTLTFAFFDKIKYDSRLHKHVVTYYRMTRDGRLDNGSTLRTEGPVVKFLLHVQEDGFILNKDRLVIRVKMEPNGEPLIDYAHVEREGPNGVERIASTS